MKQKPTKYTFDLNQQARLRLIVAAALCHALAAPSVVDAQWSGLDTQHGQATYQYDGNHLDVNILTRQFIANAQSLDIQANESVHVQQLAPSNAALFRSVGHSATKINGRLTSNGNLFLVNQNGVLFGQSAQVNVGGLVASSMQISNEDFLNERYAFHANGSSTGVSNKGVIQVADGGYLVMLGQTVNNSGTLVASNGSVVMASAETAVLDFYGNGLVKAKLSGEALKAVIAQSGTVKADGGAVQLATSSRSSAVNMTGLIQANTLVARNGVIRLEGGNHAKVDVSGTLHAKGEQTGTKGGTIAVTGEQVALRMDTTLDVSGHAGGGTALVGGDYQGSNQAVDNARTTYVAQGAQIDASAIATGDGGKAIVWADDTTRFYGQINAKGGAQSGDGGFVEVSGKQNLDFAGRIDVGAANGTGGKVLFDPENIVLNNSTQAAPTNNANGTADIAFADAPDPGTTTVQINDVRGFSELYLQATNDITVANSLRMNTNNSVFFEANNDININAEVRTQGTGGITLNADNHVNLNGRLNSYGSGAINVTADADNSGAGDININQRVFARNGGIHLTAANVLSPTTTGYVQTQGLIGQKSGDINITASKAINLASSVLSTGRNGSAGLAGAGAGNVNLTAAGAIAVNNVLAYGGNGGTGDTAGGAAGTITINSTTAGNINTGTLNARNGGARGTGLGGAAASINITNANGDVNTKNLYVHGNTNSNAGTIDITATSGNITATGNVYASGGGTAAGSSAAGGNGGDITMKASGDVAVTGRTYAQGATPRNGNTAVGGNAGNIDISGANLSFNNVIYANGGTGRGLHQAGGNAGNISLNATGSINTKQVYAYGGSGATGTGSNANGGAAGAITIASTGVGDITIGSLVNARGGAARGTGLAGAAGSINISNSNGGIATRNLITYGNLNGHGGDITVAATTGDVKVTGTVYSYGGVVNNGHTLAGGNAGDINISGVNTTITNRVNANGNTAKGTNQAGGDAGIVNIAATNALNVKDVYSRTGRATGAGAGGTVGGITLSGGTVTATSTISTTGERNGDAGHISITSTTGDVNVKNVYASGGSANAGTAGNDAGNITINAAGGLVTSNVYANGNTGNGVNQNGGNGGVIDIDAAGAITMNAVNASGGTGGSGAGSNANGGNAGAIDIQSTAAGDINFNSNLSMHSGFARGNGNGGDAGSISVKNAAGNITTKNIYAEGYNHGDGSRVTLDAENVGDVTVNGQIRAYGDVNASVNRVGTSGGNVVIKGINNTVTSTINTSGGRGRGANQIGGDAGDVTVAASGAISTQALVANGGNAGSGAGSIAAGGSAGDISLTSTGSGDITTTNITARTGYTRGSATANGAGSVNIQNDDGALTTGNITTRGQRRGVGGDVLAVTTGDISVGNVDARASNLATTDGGDVTLATTAGDATVPDIKTGGRWLVYSGDPRNDTIGSFKPTADFKQYNTNYGDTLLNGGNGFVYRYAPVITNTLTGSASKVYDGNTNINSIAGLTFNQGSAIDGDVITLSPFNSATYDNKNVGTGKTVTSNAITVTGGTNGTTLVYGYQATAATGNVGDITPKGLTLTAGNDSKVYDGTTASNTGTVSQSGLVGGDTFSAGQAFGSRNAGTTTTDVVAGYTITDGNGGNNYTVTTAQGVGTISQAALSVTAVTDTKVYDGNASSTGAPTVAGLVAGDTANFIQTFDNKNADTGKTLTAAGAVSDGNGGNNYDITYVADNTGEITQRPITVTAVTDTKIFDGTNSSSGAPVISNLAGGDTASFNQSFDNALVGTGKTLTAVGTISDGNGGNNYDITYVADNTGVINAVLDARTAAALGGELTGLPNVQGVNVESVGATAAGGGVDETCETAVASSSNPNTATILNFGIDLPAGVEPNCDNGGES